MSILQKLESFLAMEAHAARVIDTCVLPDGVNYWPMLRILYNQCFASQNPLYAQMMVGQDFVIHYDLSLAAEVRAQLQRVPQGGCAYFSRAMCTVLGVQGRLFDPYLDPIAFIAQRQGVNPLKFQLATNTNLNYYLPPLVVPYDLEERPVLINQIGVYAGYQHYVDLSLEHGVPVIPYSALVQNVQRITAYHDLFTDILAAMQPSMVILEEYYNDVAQGLALACHALAIPCVEYQHGLQTWPHLPYHLQYIPPNGYPSVPEWFFVWGERDAERYKKLFAHQHFHKAGVAGKPDYFAWKMGRLPDDPALLARLHTKIKGKKVICVPMQGPGFPVPRLEECIQQAPEDWVWLLRDHPVAPPVAAYFAEKFPDQVETLAATKLNLHTVLSSSQHMLCGQSSAAFDAIALHNMQVTTLDPLGCSFFAEAIAEGSIVYTDSVPTALATIQAGLAGYPNPRPTSQYSTQNEQYLGKIIKLLYLQWKERHMQGAS